MMDFPWNLTHCPECSDTNLTESHTPTREWTCQDCNLVVSEWDLFPYASPGWPCPICGSLVIRGPKHEKWHQALRDALHDTYYDGEDRFGEFRRLVEDL